MTLALAALAVAVGAVAQSVSGIGFALVCGPFLVALLGQADGVRVAVVLSAALNVALLAREGKRVQWRVLPALVVPAALATPVTAYALRHVDPRPAALVAGAVTLVGTALLAVGRRWAGGRGRRGAIVAGAASGAMNITAGIGGPAVALYAENAAWPTAQARPTMQAYFLIVNLFTIAAVGLRAFAAPLWVALVAGSVVGALAAPRVSQPLARRATLALAAVGGALVVVRALV